jgi:hypothetical protein
MPVSSLSASVAMKAPMTATPAPQPSDQNDVSPEELRDLLMTSEPPLLVDVREPWEAGSRSSA